MRDSLLSFKITRVGASSGVILTKEAMAKLKVKNGRCGQRWIDETQLADWFGQHLKTTL